MDRLQTALALLALLCLSGSAAATLQVPGDYDTIQEAIDAAPAGETIQIAAGTYEEQLTIDKAITLSGAGAGATVVLSPDQLTNFFATSLNNYPVIYLHDSDGAIVEGLTVDGAGKGNANYRFLGIGLCNAGATIRDCAVTGIIDTPFSGSQHGIAIYAWNDVGIVHPVTISDCQADDYQKGGIVINGTMNDALVERCSTLGIGPTPTIAQNGIQFGWGAVGRAVDCTVWGHSYTGSGWASSGILAYSGEAEIDGCLVEECQSGIFFVHSSGAVEGSSIYASRAGVGLPEAEWFHGLGIDDIGPGSPRPQPFDDGQPTRGRSVLTVIGNTFQGDHSPNSTGIALWAQEGDNLDVFVDRCAILGWDNGISVWDDASATPLLQVTSSCFYGNLSYAVVNESSAPTLVRAEGNWWGDPSGPSGAGPGSGQPVSPDVSFSPWLIGNPCGPSAVDEPELPPAEMTTWGALKAAFR